MKLLKQILLFPLSLIFGFVVEIRNFLYNKNFLSAKTAVLPVICVGNLSMGGTGKTPFSSLIIEKLLEAGYRPAYLSRGYKRKSKGIKTGNNHSNAHELGDEALMIYRKFQIPVVVSQKRVEGVEALKKFFPDTDIVVMDDGFQHRQLKAGLYILLSSFDNPFFSDYLFPAGTLRERRKGAKRANVLVFTRCPDSFTSGEKSLFVQKASKYFTEDEIYFAGIEYEDFILNPCSGNKKSLSEVKNYHALVFAGIANPTPFFHFCENHLQVSKKLVYPDHYDFQGADIEKIVHEFQQIQSNDKILLTTEKDFYRMYKSHVWNIIESLPLYIIRINVKLLEEEEKFWNKIFAYAGKNKGNC